MRTKTVVLSALIGLAGAASVMAQTVYSLNTVGYINVTCPPGFSMIANQLDSGTNTLDNLLKGVPDGCQIYKFVNGEGYRVFAYDSLNGADGNGGWDPAGYCAETLNPGEGIFFRNNQATNLVFTFVGNVLQGTTTNQIKSGFNMISSIVPQGGAVDGFSLPANVGDQIYQYVNGAGYSVFAYDDLGGADGNGGWYNPPNPNFNLVVGQSFFLRTGTPSNWVRTFNVQ